MNRLVTTVYKMVNKSLSHVKKGRTLRAASTTPRMVRRKPASVKLISPRVVMAAPTIRGRRERYVMVL